MIHSSEKQERQLTSFLIRDILRQQDSEESVAVDSDGEQQPSPLSAGTNSDTEESLKDSDGKDTGLLNTHASIWL